MERGEGRGRGDQRDGGERGGRGRGDQREGGERGGERKRGLEGG